MAQTKYLRAYIDESGAKNPVFIDRMKVAADVFHFIHTDGLYKGDRVFRAAEVMAFFEVLKHPNLVVTTGAPFMLKDDKWWRSKLIWLSKNSQRLSEEQRPRGTVGEMLLAYVLHDRELVFKHRGYEGTDKAYLPLLLAPPPPAPPLRHLVTLYGSGVMCFQYPNPKGAERESRKLASSYFPAVAAYRWGVTPIKNNYKYP
jgi:hypothetical protein